MLFSKVNLWAECERLRQQSNLSVSQLSRIVAPDNNSTLYASRRNINDGGTTLVFNTLRHFGLKQLVLAKDNPNNPKQKFQTVINFTNATNQEILEQMIYSTGILAYLTPLTKIPQTLRKAITTGQADSNLTLTTFEKAYTRIGGITMEFHYETLQTMEEMF